MSTPRCTTCGGHQTGSCCSCGYNDEAERHAKTRAQLAARDRECERLRAALQPFADAADEEDKRIYPLRDRERVEIEITVGHLRAARTALSPPPKSEEQP